MGKIGGMIGAGIILVIWIFQGCAGRDEKSLYNKVQRRADELRTLQQSEKVVFREGDENETIVIATYLGDEDGEKEHFIVAVHPTDGLAADRPVSLAGSETERIERIVYAQVPVEVRRTLPPWFGFYRVLFTENKNRSLELRIRDSQGEEKVLRFYKGPKYLGKKTKL